MIVSVNPVGEIILDKAKLTFYPCMYNTSGHRSYFDEKVQARQQTQPQNNKITGTTTINYLYHVN